MFTAAVTETLAQIERLDAAQKASGQDIPFWRVSADNGRLLHILCRTVAARRAVELGTSSGYSGIHLASALTSTGGHLWTFELEPFKLELSARHFAQAGLAERITQVPGDILQTLPGLLASSPEPIDFAFLDAVKPHYIRYLELLRPHLRPGSILAADNVGRRNAAAVADYLAAVETGPFVTTIVPTANAEGEPDALAVTLVQG